MTAELTQLSLSLSPNRQTHLSKLTRHDWFNNTSFEIQKEVLTLPEDHNGFIEDLSNRPDEIGEVDVLRLLSLKAGNFLITPIFEVRSNITNQIFTYEYVSWKTGSRPGARFIIFLETEGKITHFVVSKSHKFSTNTENYEAIGGLYAHFLENKLQNLPNKIEKEICFHLGVDNLEFKNVINLGPAHPDLGITNNMSDLYAVTIDISALPNLTTKSDFRSTHKPVGFEIKILHISEFKAFLTQINDNYFLSAAARVLVHQDISLEI